MVKNIILLLMIFLLFLAGCGSLEVQQKEVTCSDGEEMVDGECQKTVEETLGTKVEIEKPVFNDSNVKEPIFNETKDDESVVEEFEEKDSKNKVFKISAYDYGYIMDGVNNPNITVNKGDNVTIILTSIDGSHNIRIDKLALTSNTVMTDEKTELNFIADKVGTFQYHCKVGKHEKLGQEGYLIVKE